VERSRGFFRVPLVLRPEVELPGERIR